jgi:hypothetical protein
MPLDILLMMDGEVFRKEKGYWVKIEAKRVQASRERPQGISYSITLHDRNNTRILGYDNAHAMKTKKKGYGARKVTWDHVHRIDVVTPYEYESAAKLLEDFWNEANAIMGLK